MRVLSVNVGLPREVLWRGKPVTTGIFKEPVAGRVPLRTAQPRRRPPGRPARPRRPGQGRLRLPVRVLRALVARAAGARLRPRGTFGENLTTEGLLDEDVSVGDRFRVGTAELVVTQPRLPCFKLGIKMGRDEFVTEFLERGLLGFYLAVAREGEVAAGDPIVELERDPRGFGVTEVARLYAHDRDDVEGMRRAAELDVLPESWRGYFRRRLPAASPVVE